MPSRKLPALELSVEEVGPDTAANWLLKNTHNRKFSERLGLTYAEIMAEGDWRLNGEPIIFDKTDRLQSGQHRLWAIVESGATIWTVVVRGAEPESIYSLESGRRRRMTDVLTLKGEQDVANLSAALTWTWRYDNNLMDRHDTIVHSHMLRILEKNPELREELTQGRRIQSAVGVSAGLMTALYHQFYKISPEDTQNWWEHIVAGENLGKDHPALAWRRWVINKKTAQERIYMPALAAISVKGWNAYREHRTVRALSWKPEEMFPEVV